MNYFLNRDAGGSERHIRSMLLEQFASFMAFSMTPILRFGKKGSAKTIEGSCYGHHDRYKKRYNENEDRPLLSIETENMGSWYR